VQVLEHSLSLDVLKGIRAVLGVEASSNEFAETLAFLRLIGVVYAIYCYYSIRFCLFFYIK